MIDACREQKMNDFQEVFGEIIKVCENRKMDSKEVINALGCSIALLALGSEDPKGYMKDITDRMHAYTEALIETADIKHG